MHFRFHRFCIPLLCAKYVWCHSHFSLFAYLLCSVRVISFLLFIPFGVFFFSRRSRCNVTVIVCLLCSNKTKWNKNICAEIYMRMWHRFTLQWKCFLFPKWWQHFFLRLLTNAAKSMKRFFSFCVGTWNNPLENWKKGKKNKIKQNREHICHSNDTFGSLYRLSRKWLFLHLFTSLLFLLFVLK